MSVHDIVHFAVNLHHNPEFKALATVRERVAPMKCESLLLVVEFDTEIYHNLARRFIVVIHGTSFEHFDKRPILRARTLQKSGWTHCRRIVEGDARINVAGG
jgi:hypothetical protein